MRYVFAACFSALVLASLATWYSLPDSGSSKPVIYWVTDANPARQEQIRIFHEWLQKHGYPAMEMRTDTGSNDDTKKIIQGVSGVGGDTVDIYSGGQLRYFQAMGLLADVTAEGKALGFDPSHTWPSCVPEITIPDVDGTLHQYSFPCNGYAPMYIVNREALRALGQPIPPMRWTLDEFERLGRQFVDATYKPGQPRRSFYADDYDFRILRRGYGLDIFNETLTACVLDDPRYVQAIERLYKWKYTDHLIPNDADKASFSTQSGYGGSNPQKFNAGEFALMLTGRHIIIESRQFDIARRKQGLPLTETTVVEPPYYEFPNTYIQARAAFVYAGSRHRELVPYFLAYLASEDYNMQIVRDGDGLPPDPRYCDTEEYRHPADHPNEWEFHDGFVKAAELAIAHTFSPFVLERTAVREDDGARDLFFNDRISAVEAGRQVSRRLNREIQRTLDEQPQLRGMYDKLVADQAEIDRLKAAGQKIPPKLVRNAFHLRYYASKGWLQ